MFSKANTSQKVKKLYVFGNEHLEDDRLSADLGRLLSKKFKIVHCRSPDELLEADEDEILILDVVKGIKEPIVIKDINQIKTNKMLSLHDFDLGFFLNFMEVMGINKKIKIIGVPAKGNIKEIAKKAEALI